MKLSIITPSFNQEAYIERTIKSVISQKGDFELEYIIIDGNSTDNSLNIIKTYAKKHKNIKYISEPDNGQSDAINKGIQKATGDIVAWLNSDDVYAQDTLQIVTEYFKKHPNTKWAYGFVDIINEQDEEILPKVTQYKKRVGKTFSLTKLLIENFISQPAVFWRRDFQEKIGPLNQNLNYTMDYELWLRMATNAKPGVIPKVLTHFRRYTQSKSGQGYNPKQFRQQYDVAKQYTRNPIIRILHKLNNLKIRLGYLFLK